MSNVRGEHITPALAASIIASVRSAFAVSAKAAYQRALDRGDTRRQHEALYALQTARANQLRAEVQTVKVKPWWAVWRRA